MALANASCRARSMFFFQAEDGIRVWSVTGVQTCALPISPVARRRRGHRAARARVRYADDERSEERRVGKECRSRGASDRYEEANKKCKKDTRHIPCISRHFSGLFHSRKRTISGQGSKESA